MVHVERNAGQRFADARSERLTDERHAGVGRLRRNAVFRRCARTRDAATEGLVHTKDAIRAMTACSNPVRLLVGLPAHDELLDQSLAVLERHNRDIVVFDILDKLRRARVVDANDPLVLHHAVAGSNDMIVEVAHLRLDSGKRSKRVDLRGHLVRAEHHIRAGLRAVVGARLAHEMR